MKKFKFNFKSIICFLISFSIIFNLITNEIKAADKDKPSLDIFNSFCEQIEKNDVVIASITDIHGDTNRYLRASKAVNKLREKSNNIWVQDNGDMFQGNLLSVLPLFSDHLKESLNKQVNRPVLGELKDKFNDFFKNVNEHPIVTCQKHIKSDAITLGNHEFMYPYNDDPNKDVMKKIYEDIEKNDGPKILAANIYKKDKNGQYTCAFNPWQVKEYKFHDKTYKVGVLGLEFIGTDDENPPYNYEGLTFCHPSNKEHSALAEVQRYVHVDPKTGKKKLINGTDNDPQEVDFFIVSYHSPSKKEDDSKLSSLRYLAANNGFVDLYIAGHDHMPLAEKLKDKNGKSVWVMNAGQSGLAMACLKIDKESNSASVKCCEVSPRLLDNYKNTNDKMIEKDTELENKIKGPLDIINELVKVPLGKTSPEFVPGADNKKESYIRKNALRAGNNDTVSLFARALNDSVKKYVPSNFYKDRHLIVFNRTGQKAIEKDSPFTLQNCYDLSYYENYFSVVKVTSKEIKEFVNAIASLYVYDKKNNKYDWTGAFPARNYIGVFYGLLCIIDPTKPIGNKVVKIISSDTGKEITDDMQFSLVLSRYDVSPDGIFGKLFSKQKFDQWDSRKLGVVEGLIKYQLAGYVLKNTPVGHDSSKFGYEFLTDANENPDPNPAKESKDKKNKGNISSILGNKTKDFNQNKDESIQNQTKSVSNSQSQTNSNNVAPDNMKNNGNNSTSTANTNKQSEANTAKSNRNSGKIVDAPKSNGNTSKVADAGRIKTGA